MPIGRRCEPLSHVRHSDRDFVSATVYIRWHPLAKALLQELTSHNLWHGFICQRKPYHFTRLLWGFKNTWTLFIWHEHWGKMWSIHMHYIHWISTSDPECSSFLRSYNFAANFKSRMVISYLASTQPCTPEPAHIYWWHLVHRTLCWMPLFSGK